MTIVGFDAFTLIHICNVLNWIGRFRMAKDGKWINESAKRAERTERDFFRPTIGQARFLICTHCVTAIAFLFLNLSNIKMRQVRPYASLQLLTSIVRLALYMVLAIFINYKGLVTCAVFPITLISSKTATEIRSFSVSTQGFGSTLICIRASAFICIWCIKKKMTLRRI